MRFIKWKGENMVKVLFVCLGNICRSPMAEFVMKDCVKKRGLESNFFFYFAASLYFFLKAPEPSVQVLQGFYKNFHFFRTKGTADAFYHLSVKLRVVLISAAPLL